MRFVGTRHVTWSERIYMVHKSLHAMQVHCFFYLRWCILFISIFIMLTHVDTLITLYFNVCRWYLKKMKTINTINKTFLHITQVMEVSRALTIVPTKNDDKYISISMQAIAFFETFVCENYTILFNVMVILFQLKENGLHIAVPFCMTKNLLFMYNKVRFDLFYCVVWCHCEMLHHLLNIWMIKYYNEELMQNMMI